MKTQRRLLSAVLLVSMLLSLFSGYPSAAAAQSATTVTTDSELAYDPLAQTASIAYEQHEDGYAVSLDRAADSVTMNITAVPGGENNRAVENARLYIHTGVALKPGTAYRVSFSLWAKQAQPEYAVRFDGTSKEAAYGALDGRSIEADGTDQVKYQVTSEAEHGELVLRLLLGKTGAAGNMLRFSNLAVEEVSGSEIGQSAVLADNLDYNAPGFIRLWTNTDRSANITCDGKSATLTVTKGPVEGAEVWKIKLLIATGLKPTAGKTYHFTADVDSTAQKGFELCYNDGDNEKGFGAEYSQWLTGKAQTLDYFFSIPEDKKDPGELIIQFSLGNLKTGDKLTISNIALTESSTRYTNVLSSDFSLSSGNVSVSLPDPAVSAVGQVSGSGIDWLSTSSVSKSGDKAGSLTISGGSATLKISRGATAVYDARLNIDTDTSLKVGAAYRVSFEMKSARIYPGPIEGRPASEYEILYGTGYKENGIDNNEAYNCSRKWIKLYEDDVNTWVEQTCQIVPEVEGKLLISLQLGATDGKGNTVAVRNFRIEQVQETLFAGNLASGIIYPTASSAPVETANSFSLRDGKGGDIAQGDTAKSAVLTCEDPDRGTDTGAWTRGLCVKDICDITAGKSYQVSFKIEANNAVNGYNVRFFPDANESAWNDGHAFKTEENLSLSKDTPVNAQYTITPGNNGKLFIRFDLGNAAVGTKITVSNIEVQEITGSTSTMKPIAVNCSDSNTEARDSKGTVSVSGGTVTMSLGDGSEAPEAWQRGLFVNNVCELSAGRDYEVSFNIKTNGKTFDFDVCYNKNAQFGGDCEEKYGKKPGLTASSTSQTVNHTITSAEAGKLFLQINLGLAAKGTVVTISNITVTDLSDNTGLTVSCGDSNARDLKGTVNVSGGTVTMSLGDGSEAPEAWPRGLFVNEICELSVGKNYEVSFNIKTNGKTFDFDVCYNKNAQFGGDCEEKYGKKPGLTASSTSQTVNHTITSAEAGKLFLQINLGLAAKDTVVTVSNIVVKESTTTGGTPDGNNIAHVNYPPTAASAPETNFAFRGFDGDPRGMLSGDGSTCATMTCTGDTDEEWQRGLCVKDICDVTAGHSYRVSYEITSNADVDGYNVRFLPSTGDSSWKDDLAFSSETSLKLTADKTKSVGYTVSPNQSGKLFMRLDLGKVPTGKTVTVRNIKVQEIGYTTISDQTISAFTSVWEEHDGGKGYTAELNRQNGKAVYTVRAGSEDKQGYYAKLFIDTGVAYNSNKIYRAKFNLTAERAQSDFCVISKGVSDSEDIRGTWGLSIDAGETKAITTRPIPAGKGTGEMVLQIELGKLNGAENTFTVSNVRVEEVECSYDYVTNLACRGGFASLTVSDTPPVNEMEPWKVKMFIDTGVYVYKGEKYHVAFDTLADYDMDFEVCYNRDGVEKGYGEIFDLHAAEDKVKTVEKDFTASKDGNLKIQLSLGVVQAPNTVTVENLKIKQVDYSYSGKSVLPAEVEYKTPSAVSYWAHEDYKTSFTGTDKAITANITSAPEKGAEPWKIKLFLDTGAALEAGKYYKVTANVKAKNSQDYEICYNNGGIEMGYDALGGLRLTGGETQTVERIISVPADKTDLNSLTLQFNLGKTTSANAVTVSGVKVEEAPMTYTNVMAKDFSYTAGRSVNVWTNPDCTAKLEGGNGQATLHITDVPSTGAEVWKVKLLVSTGAILQAGKSYLVRAELLASKAQNYEVCFNNEETEKGFDALYNQSLLAGRPTVVEKKLSIPASMTDAGELILQFSVGSPAANDITVSKVSVQELNFGADGGNSVADTVINLYNAPQTAAGTLDIARGKLTYKMTKISSAAKDNAVTIAGADLRSGDLYTVAFTARADQNLTGAFALSQGDGKTPVISQQFNLTTTETKYTFTTKERLSEGGLYDLLWQFGSAENQKAGSASVEISNISVYSPPEKLQIIHGKQNVTVNGQKVTPDTYNINGNNYVKLRDLALLLNDTDAQFVVRYNAKTKLISLTTGKAYTPVGGELVTAKDQAASCVRSFANVAVNGQKVNLKAYNIGGNNFFRLRDLDNLLGFKVEYVAEGNAAAITSPLTPEAQEKRHAYDLFFLPEVDGESQPYVGDTMPYYENGVYYIYYLKDGGDSYNHSVYVTTTKDFVHYTEHDNPVLSASREDVQDNWIGTGSVVKVEDTYYFFYTGFNASGSQEYHEKIMVAKGSSPTSFEKVTGWEIVPPAELGQKNDFRDPQAYYDPVSKTISLTVTTSQEGKARIVKYTLGKDLQSVKYDGIIYTDPTGQFWNLECSDTFRMGNKWYLTYSGQEDTLWYAMADSRFGPYTNPARLEGKLFYAAKHVEDGRNTYMVGWARRANSASSTQEVAGWAGNLAVQKLQQQADGRLTLVPVDSIVSEFDAQKELALGGAEASLKAGSTYSYKEAFTSYESFMLKGEFTYSGTGSFGLAFDFNGKQEQYKLISLDPAANKLSLSLNEGTTPITETQAALSPNQKHSFTYIQDGSVGIFYLDNQAALLVRVYGVTNKPIYLFAENNSVTFTSLRQYTQ